MHVSQTTQTSQLLIRRNWNLHTTRNTTFHIKNMKCLQDQISRVLLSFSTFLDKSKTSDWIYGQTNRQRSGWWWWMNAAGKNFKTQNICLCFYFIFFTAFQIWKILESHMFPNFSWLCRNPDSSKVSGSAAAKIKQVVNKPRLSVCCCSRLKPHSGITCRRQRNLFRRSWDEYQDRCWWLHCIFPLSR